MKVDWKTAALAVSAAGVWGLFFAITHDGRPAAAKKLVADGLRDPASAQFRDVRMNGEAVCGEVNGKNGFGAYAGFRHFVVSDRTVTLEPDLPTERLHPGVSPAALEQWNRHNEFSGVWLMRCQEPLPPLPVDLAPDFPALKP